MAKKAQFVACVDLTGQSIFYRHVLLLSRVLKVPQLTKFARNCDKGRD